MQGWVRERQVGDFHARTTKIVEKIPDDVRASWPTAVTRKGRALSWIDNANHPKDPRQRGRPSDHYLPLLTKAIELLQHENNWTRYRAHRYIADRMLSLLPRHIVERALDIPDHVVANLPDDARHAVARKWIVRRLSLYRR
jgi:hypothetical protein